MTRDFQFVLLDSLMSLNCYTDLNSVPATWALCLCSTAYVLANLHISFVAN